MGAKSPVSLIAIVLEIQSAEVVLVPKPLETEYDYCLSTVKAGGIQN